MPAVRPWSRAGSHSPNPLRLPVAGSTTVAMSPAAIDVGDVGSHLFVDGDAAFGLDARAVQELGVGADADGDADEVALELAGCS